MKRTVLAFLLLLSSTAACPVKPGFFANGQYRDTTGLVPQCTPAFRKLAAQVKPTQYSEIYRITTDMEGGLKVLAAAELLVSNGWKKIDMPSVGTSRVFGFQKGGKQIVLTVRHETDSSLVVVTGDR
ncbi:hypothetical protein [Deinococcus sp. UYEF24]